MLVLKRRVEEKIVIGDDPGRQIIIQVCWIRGDEVRLGIEAPPDVSVHRQEVYDGLMARDGRVTPGGRLGERVGNRADDRPAVRVGEGAARMRGPAVRRGEEVR